MIYIKNGGLRVKIKKAGLIFLSLIILGGFLILHANAGAKPIKIAVASEGETMDSQVGELGARCSWFLFFDQDGALKNTLENPHMQETEAGLKCAQFLEDHDVTIFVAGKIGEKMGEALESRGIDFISFSGTVEDAVIQAMK